jgi:hypothetical protein
VRIHVSFDAHAVQVPRIEFTIFSADRASTLVPPTPLPIAAGPPLSSPQSVVVLLPDRPATVICRARLLAAPPAQEELVAEAMADVRPHQVTEVTIAFTAAGDGGTDAPIADGGDASAADAPADDASAGKSNGAACQQADECSCGFCADHRCCDKACDGRCEDCDLKDNVGTCSPLPAGTPAPTGDCLTEPASSCGYDGTCDGTGGCRKHTAGTECIPATCSSTRTMVMSSASCDGDGACVPGPQIACDPFLCDPATGKCFGACSSSAQCAPGRSCSTSFGTCGPKPLGAQCFGSDECSGGAVCADGVCCSTACGRSCFACNLPGHEGLCTAIPAGAPDPRSVCADAGQASCGSNGLCDGSGGCQRYPLGTICAPSMCSPTPRQVFPAKTCDATGQCTGPQPVTCGNRFACNAATGSFVEPCTSDDQCVLSCSTSTGRCR